MLHYKPRKYSILLIDLESITMSRSISRVYRHTSNYAQISKKRAAHESSSRREAREDPEKRDSSRIQEEAVKGGSEMLVS